MGTLKRWKLSETVTVFVLAVALGVLFWGWTLFTAITQPLTSIGLSYLFVGVWFMGGTLVPFLIRKPGVALVAEAAAGLLEGFITQWGITALIWGGVQGIACEIIFLLFRYRRWNMGVLALAGAFAGLLSYFLDFFYSHYAGLQLWVIFVQIGSALVSGAVLGGVLAYVIGRAIQRTGALRTIVGEGPAEST